MLMFYTVSLITFFSYLNTVDFYSGNFRGLDIVKTFRGVIFEDYNYINSPIAKFTS